MKCPMCGGESWDLMCHQCPIPFPEPFRVGGVTEVKEETMSKKDEAFQQIETLLSDFGLTDPTQSNSKHADGKKYAIWLVELQESLLDMAECEFTIDQMDTIHRFLLAVLCQASKADGTKSHDKMMAEAMSNLRGIGHLPASVVEALNSGDGSYKP